jgi:hypothetical protein
MKPIILNFILFLSFSTFAQVDANLYNTLVNQVFQNVNQAHATSGFLMPKALRMIDYENYDGATLTATNKATYAKLVNVYSMLYMAKTNNNVSLVEPSYFYNYNMGGG